MPLRVFIVVPMTISAAVDSFAARADLCHQYSLSPVESLTPANSLSPVSMTPVITFFPGVVDTGQK